MERKIILIPDCSEKAALNIAFCIKKAHGICHVIGASTRKSSPANFSRFFDDVFYIDGSNEVEELLNIVKREKVDVMFPAGIRDISLITHNLDQFLPYCHVVPTPSLEQLAVTTDKWLFYRKMVKQEIDVPDSWLLSSGHQHHIDDVAFPLISKPLIGSGGEQIAMINDRAELDAHLKERRDNGGNYLLQEFIPGINIHCSVLCRNGKVLAYTIQEDIDSGQNNFKPSKAIQFVYNDRALKTAREVVGALNFNGIAHIDFRYDEDRGRLVVIEVNPRYWASMLGSYSAGVNFPCLAVQSTLGMEFECPEYENRKFIRLSNWIKLFPSGIGKLSDTNLKLLLQDPIPRLINKLKA